MPLPKFDVDERVITTLGHQGTILEVLNLDFESDEYEYRIEFDDGSEDTAFETILTSLGKGATKPIVINDAQKLLTIARCVKLLLSIRQHFENKYGEGVNLTHVWDTTSVGMATKLLVNALLDDILVPKGDSPKLTIRSVMLYLVTAPRTKLGAVAGWYSGYSGKEGEDEQALQVVFTDCFVFLNRQPKLTQEMIDKFLANPFALYYERNKRNEQSA